MGLRVARVGLDRMLEHVDRCFGVLAGLPVVMLLATKHVVVCVQTPAWRPPSFRKLRRFNPARQCRDDGRRELVLHDEDILELSVKTVRPQGRPGVRIEELHVEANPIASPSDAAPNEKLGAELGRHLAVRHLTASIRKRRAAGNHHQRAEVRERRDDVFDGSIDEVVVFRPGEIVVATWRSDTSRPRYANVEPREITISELK